MNKLPLIFLFAFLFVLSVGGVSAVSKDEYINFLENKSLDRYFFNQSLNVGTSLVIGNGFENGSNNSYILTRNTVNETVNLTINLVNGTLNGFCAKGNYCINVTYQFNQTLANYNYLYLYKPNGAGNLSGKGYTGFGVWVYGDNSTNQIVFQIRNASAASASAKDVGSFNITWKGWRFMWLDFYNFDASYKNFTWDFGEVRIRINAKSTTNLTSSSGFSSLYFDEPQFISNNYGCLYPENWLYNLTLGNDLTDNEIVSLWAYLYENGDSRFYHNESILNRTLAGMQCLIGRSVMNYLGDKTILNDNPTGAHPMGFTGVAMMNTYRILNNSYNFSQNITISNMNLSWKDHIYYYSTYISDRWNSSNYRKKNSGGVAWVTNQDLIYLHLNWLINNTFIQAPITYFNRWNNGVDQAIIDSNNFGLHPEADAFAIWPSNVVYLDKYDYVDLSILANMYAKSNDNRLLSMVNNYSSLYQVMFRDSSTNNNLSIRVINGTRQSVSNSSFVYGHYGISNITNNSIIRQLVYGLTDLNSSNWVPADSYAHLFDLEYYTITADQGIRFPQEYSYIYYDLINNSNGYVSRFSNVNNLYYRTNTTYPRMLFWYDNNNSWGIRGDYLTSNSSNWIYSDENGNFTLPIVPKALISEGVTGLTRFTTSTGDNIINSTYSQNQIWFSSSTATEKHISSNLSQSVNATVVINVEDCDNTLSLTVKGTTTGYSQTYTKGQFTCSEGVATIPSTMIENSTQSTIITINTEFDSVTSSPYCRTLTGSLGDFGAMFAIIIIALMLGFVYFALVRQELITEVITAGAIVLVMAAIILILGGIVIGGLC